MFSWLRLLDIQGNIHAHRHYGEIHCNVAVRSIIQIHRMINTTEEVSRGFCMQFIAT